MKLLYIAHLGIRKAHRIVLLLMLVTHLSFNVVFADTSTIPIGLQKVVSLSGGPAWYNAGKTQTFFLQPGTQNTYVAHSSTNVLASGELFLGLQVQSYPHYFLQLGVAGVETTKAFLQGAIWELADPAFDNFTYKYKVQHSHVAGKVKVFSDSLGTTYVPYLGASFGVAFNHAYQFSMTPNIFEVIAEPPFKSQTLKSFTYTVELGFLKMFNQHWHVGWGYEFADWGKSALGPSVGQTINQGITLNHLYTNQLQFSLSYIS